MKLYLGTLLCVFGAAACSTNKPAEGAYDSSQVASNDSPVNAPDAELTPASSDGAHGADGSANSNSSSTSGMNNSDHGAAHKQQHPAGHSPDASADRSNTAAPVNPTPAEVTPAVKPTDGAAAPDNTKVNKRDTKSSALTPVDQQENSTDLKITQQIRQAVVGDGSLSFTAKNVKIITINGKVTLRGPVNTEQERKTIEAAAQKIAGTGKVDNQLEVKK